MARSSSKPTRRALLIGINEYPLQADILTACLNDVNDFAQFLVDSCDFQYDDIRLLTERRATKDEILKRLAWLVKDLRPGDQAVFLYSGHGNRLATRDIHGHVDKYYECICPYDFDWEGRNNISDRDFCELFNRVPQGVRLVWISDSCYSGGLPQLELPRPARVKPPACRTLQLPDDIAWRVRTAIEKDLQPLGMPGAVEDSHAILIAATRERQQAQEKCFQKEIKVNGLLTYYLLHELSREGGLSTPLRAVMERVGKNVRRYAAGSRPRFEQEPTLYGRPELLDRPFLE